MYYHKANNKERGRPGNEARSDHELETGKVKRWTVS